MTPIVNKDAPMTDTAADAPEDDNVPGSGAKLEMLAELLQLPATATLEEIYQAVAALLNSQAALKFKVDTIEFEAYKAKIDGAVTEALKAGKIAPYQRDWAFRNAMNDVDEFALWLKTAPQVIPMGEIEYEPLTLKASAPRSRAHELMGLSHEDIKKYGG